MKIKFLDLGMQPIANNFITADQIDDEFKFHLKVVFDTDTNLVSLGEFVPPEDMFNDTYAYHSSGSQTMRDHFKNTASELNEEFKLKSVLEIGSNDGVFLKNFEPSSTIAVEPCGNFADMTNEMGYKTYKEFWTESLAEQIKKDHGPMDLIYAANCMCHIQGIQSAFSAVNECLSDDGIFVFEDPSLSNMIRRNSYDQIYDEHAHIFSVTALKNLFEYTSLEIFRVEPLSVHGGSNRIFVSHMNTRAIEPSVSIALEEEAKLGLNEFKTYQDFSLRIHQSKEQLVGLLSELKRKSHTIVSYGATSKSTTVFNYCGIDTSLIDYIIDTTPAKQGKLSPGMHIPIVPRHGNLDSGFVDYAFLGAWNYEKEITDKEAEFLRTGRFITHVPYVRIVS